MDKEIKKALVDTDKIPPPMVDPANPEPSSSKAINVPGEKVEEAHKKFMDEEEDYDFDMEMEIGGES